MPDDRGGAAFIFLWEAREESTLRISYLKKGSKQMIGKRGRRNIVAGWFSSRRGVKKNTSSKREDRKSFTKKSRTLKEGGRGKKAWRKVPVPKRRKMMTGGTLW